MDFVNFPAGSEEYLKAHVIFPQTIRYKTTAEGSPVWRTYEICGCLEEWEHLRSGTKVQCTFHDGIGKCFWNEIQQLAQLTTAFQRIAKHITELHQEHEKILSKVRALSGIEMPPNI